MKDYDPIGLIAGQGKFPILFAQAARAKGEKIIALAIKEETSRQLEAFVDKIFWIGVGELKKLFEILEGEKIKRAVMAGKITKTLLFEQGISIDTETETLLEEIKDRKNDSLLGAVAEGFRRIGVTLLDSTTYLSHLLPSPGVLTKTQPTSRQWEDVRFGQDLAKKIAGLDIGQTVVVKDKTILAIEAIEGTDEVIKRGGRLAKAGVVVVKVSKPQQDMRFDIPVVGLKTVESLVKAKAAVLAIEAHKTLIIDRDKFIQKADRNKLSVVVI